MEEALQLALGPAAAHAIGAVEPLVEGLGASALEETTHLPPSLAPHSIDQQAVDAPRLVFCDQLSPEAPLLVPIGVFDRGQAAVAVQPAADPPLLVPIGALDRGQAAVAVQLAVDVPRLGPIGALDRGQAAIAVQLAVDVPLLGPIGALDRAQAAIAVQLALAVPPLLGVECIDVGGGSRHMGGCWWSV